MNRLASMGIFAKKAGRTLIGMGTVSKLRTMAKGISLQDFARLANLKWLQRHTCIIKPVNGVVPIEPM